MARFIGASVVVAVAVVVFTWTATANESVASESTQ
jgi:hypothetical protein